jgi:hypothetical protein
MLLIYKPSFDVTVRFLKASPQSQTTQKGIFFICDLIKITGSLVVGHATSCQRKNVNPGLAKFVEYFVTKICNSYAKKALSGGKLNVGRSRVTRKVTSFFENKRICRCT